MKKVLITGACGGIGTAIVHTLANSEMEIIAVGRTQDELDQLCTEVVSSGHICTTYVADVSNHEAVKRLASKIKETGSIDWLINAVGSIEDEKSIGSQSEESILHTFANNSLSVVFLTKFFLPILNTNGGIISLSSTTGINGSGKYPVYSASKGAVNVFSQAIAQHFNFDLSAKKLKSISVCPGPTNTAMRQRIAQDAKFHQNPELIAHVILKIVQDKSTYKNGDIITISNGTDSLFSEI